MNDSQPRSLQMVSPAILPVSPHLSIVNQVLYECDTAQNGWIPLKTIDFSVEGMEGMNLAGAKERLFNGLDSRDEPAFESGRVGTSVSCRNHVRGFYDSNFHHR
jgi:hypothetical protein